MRIENYCRRDDHNNLRQQKNNNNEHAQDYFEIQFRVISKNTRKIPHEFLKNSEYFLLRANHRKTFPSVVLSFSYENLSSRSEIEEHVQVERREVRQSQCDDYTFIRLLIETNWLLQFSVDNNNWTTSTAKDDNKHDNDIRCFKKKITKISQI